jgi:hypothetical protein
MREAGAASGPAHLIGQERPSHLLDGFLVRFHRGGHRGLDVVGLRLRWGFTTA